MKTSTWKYIYFSVLFLLLVLNCEALKASNTECDNSAVEYRPFVEDGKQWLVVCATHEIFWTKRYYIAEDTVVQNRTCKKLVCQTIDYEKKTDITELFSIIFEEAKKVYYYPNDNVLSTPILLYDFDAKEGDVVLLGGQQESVNEQVYYVMQNSLVLENNGECFRGIQASLKDEEPIEIDGEEVFSLFQWYEGIGSIFEPFAKTAWNNHMSGPLYRLYECRVNNEIIYSNTMGLILGNDMIKNTTDISVNKVFDNGNIYILHNGRKYNLLGAEVK